MKIGGDQSTLTPASLPTLGTFTFRASYINYCVYACLLVLTLCCLLCGGPIFGPVCLCLR